MNFINSRTRILPTIISRRFNKLAAQTDNSNTPDVNVNPTKNMAGTGFYKLAQKLPLQQNYINNETTFYLELAFLFLSAGVLYSWIKSKR